MPSPARPLARAHSLKEWLISTRANCKKVLTNFSRKFANNLNSSFSEKTETEEVNGDSTEVRKVQRNIPDPSETTVHGKEVHVSKQKQVQKETVGNKEITRKITATETTEVEHKGTTQERVVEGAVKPATPPVFTKKIQPCRVFENEQAKFEVEYDGDPIPKVKWFRENFEIKNSQDFQIHTFGTKSVLIIRQVFIEDSAVFAVIAENRGGTAKCSANLVVEERRKTGRSGVIPPSFVSTIQDASVSAGQLARFDARITGTKPIDVYWLKDGKKITPNIKYKMLEEDSVFTLLVIETYQEDSGKYECVAINGGGEGEKKSKKYFIHKKLMKVLFHSSMRCYVQRRCASIAKDRETNDSWCREETNHSRSTQRPESVGGLCSHIQGKGNWQAITNCSLVQGRQTDQALKVLPNDQGTRLLYS
jgi:hypothetical protein